MAKNDKNTKNNSSAYKLNTDAVDRLVNADKKSYPKIKGDIAKQYKSNGFLDRIPSWLKSLFIKFWFNGAVCYFIFWGFGLYLPNITDMIFVIAIIMGMVTDLLVNNAFRFLAVTPHSNDKWMMFPQKKFYTFFLNIIYAFAVLYIVVYMYEGINILANHLNGTEGIISIGVEPILFGISYMFVDMCFVSIKNLIVSILSDAKRKNGIE